MLQEQNIQESPSVLVVTERIQAGHRLTFDDAMELYSHASLHTLAMLAHQKRLEKHPDPVVTYVADRNINYSNVCACGCRFCAFFTAPGQDGGYVLSNEVLDAKIQETLDLGGTQILLQGGHHPDLPLQFYIDMLGHIRQKFPDIHIHAFSPPEIFFFAEQAGISVVEVIKQFKAAGMHSIPGGGAEILVTEVRKRVSPRKCTAEQWLDVMEQAHLQGLCTTATMMFGHEETIADRVQHLFAVRELQDKTGGFTAFIPWTFQPDNTQIKCVPATAPEYLRVLALARLVLDSVDNIQSSWVTMGPHVAQLALYHGANDFGSLMIEENVVAAAGVHFRLSREKIHEVIEAAGFIPAQRSMSYEIIKQG